MSFVGGGGFLLRAVLVISWKTKNKHYVLVFVKLPHSASFVVPSARAALWPHASWSHCQEAQRSTELHRVSSQLCRTHFWAKLCSGWVASAPGRVSAPGSGYGCAGAAFTALSIGLMFRHRAVCSELAFCSHSCLLQF